MNNENWENDDVCLLSNFLEEIYIKHKGQKKIKVWSYLYKYK